MKKSVWLLFLICCGCLKKPAEQSFKVSVINDSTILFHEVDKNLLANVQTDSIANVQWQSLLPVYRMPADTDMKDYQPPQPGKYLVKNGAIMFLADTPFHKKQQYFARYYRFHDDSSIWTLIRNRWKHRTSQYAEYTFKP